MASTVIDLNKILSVEQDEVQLFKAQLARQGWCFVKLPVSIQVLALAAVDPLMSFFTTDVENKEKYAIHNPLAFGYAAVPHRESLRTLTAERFNPTNLPPQCGTELRALVHEIDNVLVRLVCATSGQLFGVSARLLGKFLDFPMLNCDTVENQAGEWKERSAAYYSFPASTPAQTFPSTGAFGMLDVAHYFNRGKGPSLAVNLNCAAHYDPGLWSLSVLSTAPGLEVYDPVEAQWVKGPSTPGEIGLVWCGKAASDASNGRIKAGMHRVTFPPQDQNRSRLTMWTEICTSAQLHTYHQENDGDDEKSVASNATDKTVTSAASSSSSSSPSHSSPEHTGEGDVSDTESTISTVSSVAPVLSAPSNPAVVEAPVSAFKIVNIATTDDGVPAQPVPDFPEALRAYLLAHSPEFAATLKPTSAAPRTSVAGASVSPSSSASRSVSSSPAAAAPAATATPASTSASPSASSPSKPGLMSRMLGAFKRKGTNSNKNAQPKRSAETRLGVPMSKALDSSDFDDIDRQAEDYGLAVSKPIYVERELGVPTSKVDPTFTSEPVVKETAAAIEPQIGVPMTKLLSLPASSFANNNKKVSKSIFGKKSKPSPAPTNAAITANTANKAPSMVSTERKLGVPMSKLAPRPLTAKAKSSASASETRLGVPMSKEMPEPVFNVVAGSPPGSPDTSETTTNAIEPVESSLGVPMSKKIGPRKELAPLVSSAPAPAPVVSSSSNNNDNAAPLQPDAVASLKQLDN